MQRKLHEVEQALAAERARVGRTSRGTLEALQGHKIELFIEALHRWFGLVEHNGRLAGHVEEA